MVEMARLPDGIKPIPVVCRWKCCSCCRKICYRDKSKAKKACIQLWCPSFFVARSCANKFKMSFEVLQSSESTIQVTIFWTIIAQLAATLTLGILLPFLLRREAGQCKPMMSIPVYGAFVGFMILGTIFEVCIHQRLKSSLCHCGVHRVLCNSYVIAKWLQGQLANLGTFMHVCFCAHIVACHVGHQDTIHEELDAL
jgi:hypothetical protein